MSLISHEKDMSGHFAFRYADKERYEVTLLRRR